VPRNRKFDAARWGRLDYSPGMGIEITEEYRQVQSLIDEGTHVVYVTGKAGTGKSTLIQYLREESGGDCIVLAPTGVAAMNVQGATIHSFFRFPPRMLTSAEVREVPYKRPYENLGLMIIDEVSMVRADVLDAIDLFLRLNGPFRDRAFGGVQVLLVGDLHQLPPVVSRHDEAARFDSEYETPFFFSSRVFKTSAVTAVELTHVFRQRDQRFIDILNRIRLGDSEKDVLDEINVRVTDHPDHGRETVLTATNVIADRLNKKHLAVLPFDRRSYHAEMTGDFQVANERLPSPMELMLKPESRVMFTKNDPDGRWVNGSLGVVSEMLQNYVEVVLDGSGERVVVEPTQWETYRYEYDETEQRHVPVVSGAFQQLPLTPAWAITIHKSQGKTLASARIDLGRQAFAPGQVYVALSRCRRLEDLSLSRPIASRDVFCDARVKSFHAALFESSS